MYPDGIRHIRADKRVNEWKAPGKKTIVKCAVNQRQVVIALTGGELVYFEMDPVSLYRPDRHETIGNNALNVLSEMPSSSRRKRCKDYTYSWPSFY